MSFIVIEISDSVGVEEIVQALTKVGKEDFRIRVLDLQPSVKCARAEYSSSLIKLGLNSRAKKMIVLTDHGFDLGAFIGVS